MSVAAEAIQSLLADYAETQRVNEIASNYEPFLRALYPAPLSAEFADYHREMWDWTFALRPGIRPEPLVLIVFRGGAKSSGAEMTVATAGALRLRKYAVYVSRIQPQADDHVDAIAALFESPEMEAQFPSMSKRRVGKYGNSKGWRRTRLQTESGFVVDALGLDVAKRGAKVGSQRPDLIIFDDIDKAGDSPKTVRKLIDTITTGVLPMGASDTAIMFAQNMIHANSVVAQVASKRADFLRRRRVVGPIPALDDFTYRMTEDGEYEITGGKATWPGFPIKAAEALLNEIGPEAFRRECQHDVERVVGSFWSRAQLDAMRATSHPDLVRVVVAVDPSGGEDPENDEQGIVVVGLGSDGRCYVLEDASCKLSPAGWGRRAIDAYEQWNADVIVAEMNFGGAMVEQTIRVAAGGTPVNFKPITASRGKVQRLEPIAALCGEQDKPETWEHTRLHLVGSFSELEDEMATFAQGVGWSPNRLDAMVFAASELIGSGKPETRLYYEANDSSDEDWLD